MLKLILGRAKSGKTAGIMDEIASLTAAEQGGIVLLVPEQYSHEAETELLRRCGDSLSLYAEVFSFTRLCSRVEDELGRPEGTLLDKGGRLLCMALAVDAVGSRLKIYGSARRQPPLQSRLLRAIDGLKAACITPEQLGAFAAACSPTLAEKLGELTLIYEAYEAVLAQGRLDPTDRLTRLAGSIGHSAFARGRFYLDGFTDFTYQEREIIRSLLLAGTDVTVCLTCEGFEEGHEIFQSSRRAALALKRMAEDLSVPCEAVTAVGGGVGAMAFLERELFNFAPASFDGGGAVCLRRAGSISQECEAAAARCIDLARETGCRWRDIAVAVRSYDSYRASLESAFARCGVPLYSASKSPVTQKPLYTLISSAYETVTGGWSYEDVFTYLKTGLAGLTRAECDELENYAFTWSVKGTAWTRPGDWKMHPDGYGGKYDEQVLEKLGRINALRRRAAAPLANFEQAVRQASTALEQAAALAALFDELSLPETLERRAQELRAMGLERQAAEYVQLWEIAVSALEQCAGIAAQAQTDAESFGRLYCLTLSQYEVGTIPMSLDGVSAGDMDRMRRRNIKHLIVLGCDGTRVPLINPNDGIFSEDDLGAMLAGGIDIGNSAADRLEHEFALIYNCLTLPSETLYMSFCAGDGEEPAAPAFVMSRAAKIFSVPISTLDADDYRAAAPETALELAALSQSGLGGELGAACARYFEEKGQYARLERVRAAANLGRGHLSPAAVRALYGETPRLSASRIDKLSSCSFAYFLQYGLRAKPRLAASFSPPELGTFMHYILERVSGDISAAGGFGAVSDAQVDELCGKYVSQYVHDTLNDFSDRSARFVYLFRRLTKTVRRVVADMVRELRSSDFRPLDFELNFGKDFPPLHLGKGEQSLTLTGVADRVDGYVHDGRLYVRVVDYKTGWKKFSLSDVWHGMGLQMLLYLFALEREGGSRYGREIVPAGVMYVPARDVLVSAQSNLSDEDLAAEKSKALRRSGLLLDDADILRAMERSDAPRYLPVSIKNGAYAGDALAGSEQLGKLSRHIDQTLRSLAGELKSGSIAADPYFRSQADTACRFCDYRTACHFDEELDCRRYLEKLSAGEVWDKIDKEVGDNGL